MSDSLLHFYRIPCPISSQKISHIKSVLPSIIEVEAEYCFNVEVSLQKEITQDEKEKLLWLFTETYEPEKTSDKSFFLNETRQNVSLLEVGPRLAFTTAWSSNCISMCNACGIASVTRIERSRRFLICCLENPLTEQELNLFASLVHDRMTECVYQTPLSSFHNDNIPEAVTIVPILSEGRKALEKINNEKGLGFDEWDLDFYTDMFLQKLGRNPTDVECFDLGQSNSEHSRHWFFSGRMIIDEEEKQTTLFSMVKNTLPKDSNSIIAFHDNSSALSGYTVNALLPESPGQPAIMTPKQVLLHPILTAETHNFPSGVAPFPGAETGTGGRLRDVQATGRGAHSLAGISAYCVGNLHIPGNPMPWENSNDEYSSNLALPLAIEIDASNGASDYGNKYGEPVVAGFTRSFGQRVPSGERFEWIKPVMFTAGVGMMDALHKSKELPEIGMVVCKIGGPAYRIGMGGGAASSRVQSSNASEVALDFNAVQRGDAEMGNRLNRVVRACIELGDNNPIVSIHDQGAGGNGNVLKEIVDPLGAKLQLRSIPLGDDTLSTMEIWGAEYQENNAILVRPEHLAKVLSIGARENCPVSPVGVVTGDGRVIVEDTKDGSVPFDLPLSLVLGKMPQKSFIDKSIPKVLVPLVLPADQSVATTLTLVLKLLDVGSKRFLTNKVDRSVTGLIAQQQCVGPLQLPLSNVAVLAQTHFSTTGVAVAVGEQPIKGLISPSAQARMTVGEALTNIVWAKVTSLSDIKASGNWMWAAKLPGEGAKMWEACEAMCNLLKQLGPSIDGGKDSLSMAAKVGNETVKSPGQLTLTCYAACPDITLTVTPDLKAPGRSVLLLVDLGGGKDRLGGSALSTVLGQLGDSAADVEDVELLKNSFNAVQLLLEKRLILAGHDRSDGGLLVAAVEMAISGNCGLQLILPEPSGGNGVLGSLFGEELGLLMEVLSDDLDEVLEVLKSNSVPCSLIGSVTSTSPDKNRIVVSVGGKVVLNELTVDVRDQWESTSFSLEMLQCNPDCVVQERDGLRHRTGVTYHVTYDITPVSYATESLVASRHKVAVIRQEGSNGDREMLSALHAAGLEAWDVNMNDLSTGAITIDRFRGIVFCGGFSYADVNDSAKGWAAAIKFNPNLSAQFTSFRARADSFSLGVCNGCQLVTLLGWVPFADESVPEKDQPRFVHNASGRFESRWCAVRILPSKAVLLKGMEGSVLGVWVAHGEGRLLCPKGTSQIDAIEESSLAPIRYVDDATDITIKYPFNPNGSPNGIASLSSKDGRHLAMMPHPERCFQTWQWPHMPLGWRNELAAGPWLKMFQNAKLFCDEVSNA